MKWGVCDCRNCTSIVLITLSLLFAPFLAQAKDKQWTASSSQNQCQLQYYVDSVEDRAISFEFYTIQIRGETPREKAHADTIKLLEGESFIVGPRGGRNEPAFREGFDAVISAQSFSMIQLLFGKLKSKDPSGFSLPIYHARKDDISLIKQALVNGENLSFSFQYEDTGTVQVTIGSHSFNEANVEYMKCVENMQKEETGN